MYVDWPMIHIQVGLERISFAWFRKQKL